MRKWILLLFILPVFTLRANQIIVAESGGDYHSVQAALQAALPGDSILVKEKSTPYYEKLNFVRGGNASDGYITLMAYPGQHPILDGTDVANNSASYTDDMIYLGNIDYVRIEGFEIRNVQTTEGSGIRVYGYGSYIEIRNNEIHDIRGGGQSGGAMGITIYGADDNHSINHLIIDGNYIHDCDPAWSEALTLNGNVEHFEVTNNIVEDVNNIGIDFIGGEDWLSSKYARNGRCAWNQVYRANAAYEDGYAAGIYVDGGQDIVIENNIVSQCDLGIEIGAENAGVVTQGIKVRNNTVYRNGKAGIVFGGYDYDTGRTKNCSFTGNTCYENDSLKTGHGEIWIQYAENNDVRNNIFYANAQNILLYSETGNIANTLDYNLWYSPAGENNARWIWNNSLHTGFTDYQQGTGQDAHSLFSDPQFVASAEFNFHLSLGSPAIDRGDPAFLPDSAETDMDGQSRKIGSAVDIGADEVGATSSSSEFQPEFPDQCVLFPAYPNPFNPATVISYQLTTAANISLDVFDAQGKNVIRLYSGIQTQGFHHIRWDGKNQWGVPCPSGNYFVRLQQSQRTQTVKILLIR